MKPRWLYSSTFFIVISILFSNYINAQEQEWWFDVEIVLFKRIQDTRIDEDFTATNETLEIAATRDLLSLPFLRYSNPNHNIKRTLPECRVVEEPVLFNNIINVGDIVESNDKRDQVILYPMEKSEYTGNVDPVEYADSSEDSFEDAQKNIDDSNVSLDTDNKAVEISDDALEMYKESDNQSQVESDTANLFDLEIIAALFEDVKLDYQLRCIDDQLPEFENKIPLRLTRDSEYAIGRDEVVSSEFLRMQPLTERLFAQRNIQPLLHTVWRQNVIFGKDNAEFFKLKAGEKLRLPTFEDTFDFDDEVLTETFEHSSAFTSVLNALQKDIEENSVRDWNDKKQRKLETNYNPDQSGLDNVFEIEGRLKVYLEYINRIPYLHIDSDILHHQLLIDEDGVAQIESFPFKQRRRIISKQVHYFDHPAFGMIIRLERYEPPIEEELTEAIETDLVSQN